MYLNKEGLQELRDVVLQRPTPGRSASTAWLAPVYLGVRQTVEMFRRFDDVLYPEHRHQEIDRPVFIFASPRSGTTLTHRLISMDDEVFTTVKLYQTIFPSVTATKLFERLIGAARTRAGSGLHRLYDLLNRPFVDRWNGVHHMSLDQAEEDEATFLYSLQSPTMGLLFPFMDQLEHQTWLDRQSPEERKAFLDSYESSIQRHVYAAGGKRFLNKNVFFGTRIRAMYEKFPDAVFVYLIRNPYDSLPSFLNMFYRAWMSHSPNTPPDGEQMDALKQLGFDYYRYALECRRSIPADQFLVIRYEDLIENPKATIVSLYQQLGMPVSKAFEAKLDQAMVAHREWENPRDYTLEFFGLTREEVEYELRDVLAEFGYDEHSALTLEAAE